MTEHQPTVAEESNSTPSGIVYFDFDGALNKGSSWRAVHQTLNTVEEADENYERYITDEISFAEWGYQDATLWEGASEAEFRAATDKIETVNGIRETVNELQERGYIVGIVSGGITELIEITFEDNDLDFIIANTVHIEDGIVTGKVSMDVTAKTKSDHYRELAEQYGASLDHSISVGDSRDDFAPIKQGLNIAFNADDTQTRDSADVVIEGDDLRNIIPAIDGWQAGLEENQQT